MHIIFTRSYSLREQEVKLVQGVAGIYFIFLKDMAITYPFAASRLIYIGMSESRQHSIAMRLRGHLTGRSGNPGIANYTKAYSVKFTFYSADVLKNYGNENVFDMESFFLSDFLEVHGSYPICNGQAGHQLSATGQMLNTNVDWAFFE